MAEGGFVLEGEGVLIVRTMRGGGSTCSGLWLEGCSNNNGGLLLGVRSADCCLEGGRVLFSGAEKPICFTDFQTKTSFLQVVLKKRIGGPQVGCIGFSNSSGGLLRPPPHPPRFFIRLLFGFVTAACNRALSPVPIQPALVSIHLRSASAPCSAQLRLWPGDAPVLIRSAPLQLSSSSAPAQLQLSSSSAPALICIPAASKVQKETHATCTGKTKKY